MRHRKSGRKLGRNASHRVALFRNLTSALFEVEKIETTEPKAKELRRHAEKLITLARRHAASKVEAAGSDAEKAQLTAARVAAVRQAGKTIQDRVILEKLFGELAERYIDRPGGYTRIIKVGRRLGDGAEMAIIELIPEGDAAVQDVLLSGGEAVAAAPAETEVAEAAEVEKSADA
ncbi:MAG: 50S ribosomal protein L17 [Bradymonadia bacterium]